MAYTIAITNEKGGVGKTTTVVNLGAALAEGGRRVLGVDLDPHCGLTMSLHADGAAKDVGSLLLSPDGDGRRGINPRPTDGEGQPANDKGPGGTGSPAACGRSSEGLVLPTGIEGFDLIPSGHHVASLEGRLSRVADGRTLLRDRLRDYFEDYDFVLLDCGPSLGLLTLNALVAAQGVLIPMQSDYLAMRGVGLLLEAIRAVQAQLNPSLCVVGFLAAMHDRRTNHSREVLEEMRRLFGEQVFSTVIGYTVRLKETPLLGDSILAYDPRSRVAQAYRSLAQEVEQRAVENG